MSNARAVVEEFYRRSRAGEFDRLAELFADEVDWYVYGADEVPWTGRRSTRTEAAAFFRDLPTHLTAEELTVDRLVVDGTHVVALGNMRQRVRKTGDLFVSPFAFHFTVENGHITRYRTYEDSLALARAYGVA
ncbi:nuclear transport factor 2 family protein [Nocardia paucivorans]|uniref:nuclear transport factor 2 family protein n=1 Tax=Nocardia paucivorans TaxID=114259 RepID=UPI00031489CC|nr:nuclear transport factor 2 family protein [Nocardia paucivorans]